MSLIVNVELLKNEHGEYRLSAVKEWAETNGLDYRVNPPSGVAIKGDRVDVFPRSHNITSQVFIHREGVSVEISAV